MEESPFIDKVRPNMEAFLNKQAKFSTSINTARKWSLRSLENTLLDYIIDKLVLFLFLLVILMIKLHGNILFVVMPLLNQ